MSIRRTPALLDAAAFTGLAAAEVLHVSAPAGATPTVPLAPACRWRRPNFLSIHQDNIPVVTGLHLRQEECAYFFDLPDSEAIDRTHQ